MSKNSNTLPPKSILRNSHSSKKEDSKEQCSLPIAPPAPPVNNQLPNGRAHFDEMNIIQTHHPEGKDYGFMKIDEPKTPYHVYKEPINDDDSKIVKRGSVDYKKGGDVDPNALSKQLLDKQKTPLKSSKTPLEVDQDTEDDRVKDFKAKRAAHYGKEFVKPSQLPPDDDE